MTTIDESSYTDSDSDDDIKESMIDELFDGMEDWAKDVVQNERIVWIFEDFLNTLTLFSQSNMNDRALNHFSIVKMVWANTHFISLLLKRYLLDSRLKLSEFLMLKIRSDPSFHDIFDYQDDASMIRNALSVVIGYYSNEDNIALLVFAFGGRLLGVSQDASLSVVKEIDSLTLGESSAHSEGMSVVYSPIADIRQDESIKELADQLSNIPIARMVCQNILSTLQNAAPLGWKDRYLYHANNRLAVNSFWCNPTIIKQLIKALRKSQQLVNVLRKHSRRSQVLRCVDRMTHIQEEPLLITILESDLVERMRGALSILFGYWSEPDVTGHLNYLFKAKHVTMKLREVDITGDDDVQYFVYMCEKLGDVKGLNNVLRDKSVRKKRVYKRKILNHQGIEERKALRLDCMDVKDWRSEKMKFNNTKSADYWSVMMVVFKNGKVILCENIETKSFLIQTKVNFDDILPKELISVSSIGERSALLDAEGDKNDYDWLISPPETPLFRFLDDEAQPRAPISSQSPPKRGLSPSPCKPTPSPRRITSPGSAGALRFSSLPPTASNSVGSVASSGEW